jgi:hypothetical protein
MIPKLTLRDAILAVFVFVMFGIYVPYRRGIDFFDTLLLVPYTCISFLFCAPVVIDSIYAEGRGGVTLRPLVRGISYGWCCGLAIVATGIATVNFSLRQARVVLPPVAVLLSAFVISLLGCGFVAGISAWISFREDKPEDSKRKVRIGFLLLLCAVWFIPGLLPTEWQDWLALQLTSDKMARNTLLAAPVLALADILIFVRVIGRVHPGERNSLKIW